LSDIVMPGGMNGVELARAVQVRRPDLPILLTTGYAGERFDDGRGPVTWPVLRKPFRSEELSALLRDTLAMADQ
ncbi:MAG TPA: hypothetical protein PLG07_06495, partial [Phenylobacterium sp.]|nr:hypothetical protein [Phenylobacterium sp.]